MINIILVEQNVMLSTTLNELLCKDDMLNVVCIARNGAIGLAHLNDNAIDVVIIDPAQDKDLEYTNRIKKKYPKTKVIVYSTYGMISKMGMVHIEADSFLSKYDDCLGDLIQEIKKVTSLEDKQIK